MPRPTQPKPFHGGNLVSLVLLLPTILSGALTTTAFVKQFSGSSFAAAFPFIFQFVEWFFQCLYLAHESIPAFAFGKNDPTDFVGATTRLRLDKTFLFSFLAPLFISFGIFWNPIPETWASFCLDTSLLGIAYYMFLNFAKEYDALKAQMKADEEAKLQKSIERRNSLRPTSARMSRQTPDIELGAVGRQRANSRAPPSFQ